jgi:hypothetical protein
MGAKTRGLSLFPNHEAIIDRAAALRGLQGNTFSPAIQFIITDWAALRGLTPAPPSITDLVDGALTAYPPHNPRVNILRESTLMEQSDLPEVVGEEEDGTRFRQVSALAPRRIADENEEGAL